MKEGYKGDRVCQNCGQNDPNDLPAEEKVIPATKTEHEGVLLPLFYDRNDKTPTTDRSSGKRYRRADEIGTPFCITFDFDSLEDN